MRERILAVIEKNSRISVKELADLLGENEAAVAAEIAEMENEHIICGYHTLINWDNTDEEKVIALIEVKVTPQREMGFDKIAERIYQYSEVTSVYLMSGGYDQTFSNIGKDLKIADVSTAGGESLSIDPDSRVVLPKTADFSETTTSFDYEIPAGAPDGTIKRHTACTAYAPLFRFQKCLPADSNPFFAKKRSAVQSQFPDKPEESSR